MFSQTLEYAVRVVAHLASLGGEPATAKQVAAATCVPASYLAKVLQSLNRAGLVSSQRGLHGGSVLGRPAEQITLYDVAQAIDPIPRIRTCPLGLKSHGSRLCPVHRKLDNAMDMVEQAFRASTIADLLSEPSAGRPLCEAPPEEAKTGGKGEGKTRGGGKSLPVVALGAPKKR
jgi:Rrf2 family protein